MIEDDTDEALARIERRHAAARGIDGLLRALTAMGVVAVVMIDKESGADLARSTWLGTARTELLVTCAGRIGAIEWRTVDGKWHARDTEAAGHPVEVGMTWPVEITLGGP